MIARYTLPEMGKLWTDQSKFETWLEVELAAADAMAQRKIIPKAAAVSLRKFAKFDIARIDEIEREVNHDVIAFLTSVSESVGSSGKYLHFGMTSSDVVDTSLSLTMVRAAKIIDKKLQRAIASVKKLSLVHRATPCVGRTHGMIAEPTTFGLKLAVWYTELKRRREHFARATEGIRVGNLSGAVGNYSNLIPEVEALVCKKLGLKPAPVSTQVLQRDRHAEFVTSLSLVASSLEKFATEIRNLQRTEIGEVAEAFGKGQKGSSAMPHKRNPITAERISGIARVMRGYAIASMENVPLWHERDIAHSSVERVILPDATILVDYALEKFIDLVDRLTVNPERMLRNLYYGGGLVFSQKVLLKLAKATGSREVAYRLVQRNALAAADGRGDFRALLWRDKDVRKHFSKRELDACFDLKQYLRNVPRIFARVYGS